MNYKKILPAIIIVWSGFIVAAYFVVQKPIALQVIDHLMSLVWTLLVTVMLLLNALALGKFTIKRFIVDAPEDPALLALAGGIGLGELGLLGFLFAAVGASKFLILLTAQVLLLGWGAWKGILQDVLSLIRSSIAEIRSSGFLIPLWMKWASILALTLTLLTTLLPPADAFDALLYHLTIPARWIQDGGIRAYNFPHYWFPSIVEGVYLWGLGLGSEIIPQQIHFAWALSMIILIWDWTRRMWGDLTAWWALMLLISVPSLLRLASWAYTDMALAFFAVALLYTLSLGREGSDTRWWRLSAMSAGMAMGVKYTSFVIPLTAIVLISIWEFRKKSELYVEAMKFIFITTATACIWYLRNWVWMGNPFYPFVFGGRYWDSFRSAWFAGPGTGSGWDLKALILLPLTITLGYQDANSIDANIGPLLLLTLPFALWVIFRQKHAESSRKIALTTISFFSFVGAAFWVCGYIATKNLWQTRLLLPAIIPFVIPAAVGMISISGLDTKQFRLSFIVSSIAAISIYINILDMGLSVIARNPISIAAGIATRQNYFERYQPGYAHALEMASQISSNSRIYALFEPRSYGIDRNIQPDPILDNFSHDVYLHGSAESIVNTWRSQGYTHILINMGAAHFVLGDTDDITVLDKTIGLLNLVSISPDGSYELLEVPTR